MNRARNRIPRTLFRGRIRTSTALLGLLFVGVLLLWYGVRPDPEYTEEVVRVRTTRVTEKEAAQLQRRLDEERRPAVESPSPTPTPTPTPRASKTSAPIRPPGATPGSPGTVPPLLTPAPSDDVTPTPSSARDPGFFGLRRGGDSPPSPTPDTMG